MGTALAAVLAVGACSAGAEPGTGRGGGPALIVVEHLPRAKGKSTLDMRLVRYRFRDGKLDGPGEVLHTAASAVLGAPVGVIAGRYVVTGRGDVFDLTARAMVCTVKPSTRLLGVHDGRVVYWQIASPGGTNELAVFDPARDTVEKRSDPNARVIISGLRSPGGRQSVEASVGELTLHRPGRTGVPLGKDFMPASLMGMPLFWLDDDRFLALLKDYRLVVVDADGDRTVVAQLPPTERPPSIEYFRDPAGQLVYSDSNRAFKIDVPGQKYESYEWYQAGSGFEVQWRPTFAKTELRPGVWGQEYRKVVRYRGAEVGRLAINQPRRTHATEGYFCATARGEDGREDTYVWSAANKTWTRLGIGAVGIAGWVK